MEASRGPGGFGGWIRLTGKANWRVARVDFGPYMASAAILGSVTWHMSNVSVIDHTMSGGPNNLLFGLFGLLTAFRAAEPACTLLSWIADWAYVSGQVAFYARQRPRFHGTSVTPSGRFLPVIHRE